MGVGWYTSLHGSATLLLALVCAGRFGGGGLVCLASLRYGLCTGLADGQDAEAALDWLPEFVGYALECCSGSRIS